MSRPPYRPPPPRLRLPAPRRSRVAGPAALVAHVLLALLLIRITSRSGSWDAPALAGANDATGGGGGGTMAYIVLPEAPPRTPVEPVVRPRTPPPEPVPVDPPPVLPPVSAPPLDTLPASAVPAAGSAGTGGGNGGGAGTGSGPGTGPGSGPGNSGGPAGGAGDPAGSLARAPEPRQLILPPFDFPRAMRGMTIQVTFVVDASGRVADVAFAPEVPDRGYAKKLDDVMRGYRFRPARSTEGLPVRGVTTVNITF